MGSTIFVPSSTEPDVVEKLRGLGAEVVVGGDSWDQADAGARVLVGEKKGAVYVHPFIGDELVKGHASLVEEIYEQMEGKEVDAIVCSTGGGGLLRGIILGVQEAQKGEGRERPTLVAVQNFGVNSFNLSFDRHLLSPSSSPPSEVVALDRIASKCTSMGTKKCSLATVHSAIDHNASGGGITTLTVTDDLSASACWQFSKLSPELEKGRTRLVELSCASALTPVFHPWILHRVIEGSKGLKAKVGRGERLNMVIEVCGGSKVNRGLLQEYERSAGKMEQGDRIRVNGVDFPSSSQ